MNARIVVSTALLAIAVSQANASESTLAWQTPGYVMEEVVVTAPAPVEKIVPAWLAPGYVMEEVVVTASRSEIAARETGAEPTLLLALREAHEAAEWHSRKDADTTRSR